MYETIDEYSKIRTAFLIVYPNCQAKLVGCTGKASDIHHKDGRGENHLNTCTWLSVCRKCHRWIEENPIEAKELGLSKSRLKGKTNE